MRFLEPESEDAWNQITAWYTECREKHDDCRLSRTTQGPGRLLYIGNGPLDDSHTIRLVICDFDAVPEYVALSHCWGSGKNKPPQTTRENITEHLSEIKIASLSRTFRDAVAVCRRLKEQYLWIDSLCIIQDDAGDKAIEIPRMQAIYEGAALTITAMSARDGRGGCWVPARHEFHLPTGQGTSIKLAFHRRLESMCQHAPFLETGLDRDLSAKYPLATRKWTLQERVLSRRILHFTANDLVWECRCKAYCSCTAVDMHRQDDYTQRKVFNILSGKETEHFGVIFEWMKLVVSYSRARISNHEDIFPALAGLASGFSDKNLGKYCAGLWETDLPLMLCWYTDQGEYPDIAINFRFPKYVAPTWSWASVDGPLCFDELEELDTDPESICYVAKVLSISCETEDEFGQVLSGALKIHTLACAMPPDSFTAATILGFEDAEFKIDTLSDTPRGQKCILAAMFFRAPDEGRALVLVENPDGSHRRCGMAVLWGSVLGRFIKTSRFTDFEIV